MGLAVPFLEMSVSQYSTVLRHVKTLAKTRQRETSTPYCELLEAIAKEHGFDDYRQLQQRAAAEDAPRFLPDLAEPLDVPIGTPIVYRVKIGASAWSLRIGRHGPELHLEYQPFTKTPDLSNVSDMGIFPVLVRAESLHTTHSKYPDTGYAVARYGDYRSHTLDFMSDSEVQTLSHSFGIPFAHEIRLRNQQRVTEIRFLVSLLISTPN